MSGKEPFAYAIAFQGAAFVMVRHRGRAWEMPGGRLEAGESFEQAAVREFSEETGMALEPVGMLEVEGGKVVVGLVHSRCCSPSLSDEIAEVRMFEELPWELSFPLVEYQGMLVQARGIVETFKRGKGIVGLPRH
jgi:8-oxo-dGTP pyrophosphatase MutT (NUDIX family)